MTELSLAAQAVVNAAVEAGGGYGKATPVLHARLASALEAAADQADPKRNIKDISYQHQLYVDGWKDALDKVLAIAAELRGNTTTEDNLSHA